MRSTFPTLFRQAASRRTHPSFAARRFASTSQASEGAGSSKQVQDALGAAQRLLASAGRMFGPLGERAAGLLGSYRQPLIYNAEVARELLKQIYITERLQPPTSLATITDAYSVLWGRAKNPHYWRDLLTTGEWARVTVYAVEAYAIFKVGSLLVSFVQDSFLCSSFLLVPGADWLREQVGEIIGRRHLIGYKLH
ncbi:hypothetical protein JVT61DRAFT_13345 [Boletus reticuloceps]|uniref:Uncharacterized protein n=1 Tax=Boletus reticuloceps TaxID=495285 RepID=A0A8I2YDI6_9AGAM|nr:hypothetical protein JVT61DRAFT_13345 [Boletus reticuloceps]